MSGCQTCGGFGGRHDPIAHNDWLARDDDDCPVDCDPAFVVPVAIDESQCLACGRRGVLGDDA